MYQMFEVGSVIKDSKGTLWVIIKRESYAASAHNDRWLDYYSTILKVNKSGKISNKQRWISTDDVLRGYKIVGKADVTYTVNVDNLYVEK